MSLPLITNSLKNDIKNLRETLSQNSNPRCMNFMDEAETAAFKAEQSMRTAHVRYLEMLHYNLEICCRQAAALAKEASDASWAANPDRMGGAYSEDELKDKGWK